MIISKNNLNILLVKCVLGIKAIPKLLRYSYCFSNMEVNTLNRTSRCQIIGGNQQKFSKEYQERIQDKGDLTLKVNDESTQVHRAVLMEKSDYFISIFSGQFSESSTACIDLSHCFSDIEELNIVVEYMYTGKVLLTKENITLMVNSASLFLLTDLMSACSEFLMANLAPCTCISIFVLAEKYSLKKLRDGCLEIFKAWFPFYLSHLKEALEIPPDCMKVMVKDNVFELIAEEVRVTYLKKWCEHLGETTAGMVPVPEEVQRRIQNIDSPAPAESNADTKTPKDNEMQEVLLAIFYPEGSGKTFPRGRWEPEGRSIEVLAFSPKLKTWKSLLHHTFCDCVHPTLIEKLIGINEDKAYFLFENESQGECASRGGETRLEECIVSVDLQSKKDDLIYLAYETYLSQFSPALFLWDSALYGFFFVEDEGHWSLYKNEHKRECRRDTCDRGCWDPVCDLPLERPGCDSPKYGHDSFVVKAFGEDVYFGLENTETIQLELVFFHLYKDARGKHHIVELPSPVGSEDFESTNCPVFSCIHADYEAELLTFILKMDDGELLPVPDLAHYRDQSYEQNIYTYDVSSKSWKGQTLQEVVYPEELPKALEVTRKIKDLKTRKDNFLEEASVHWYFARSTSPYNTSIWRAGEDGKCELVTHAPCALSTISRMTTGEMSTRFLRRMPEAKIKDFSQGFGQSALTTLVEEGGEEDFELHFEFEEDEKLLGEGSEEGSQLDLEEEEEKKLLDLKEWETTSAELWEGRDCYHYKRCSERSGRYW